MWVLIAVTQRTHLYAADETRKTPTDDQRTSNFMNSEDVKFTVRLQNLPSAEKANADVALLMRLKNLGSKTWYFSRDAYRRGVVLRVTDGHGVEVPASETGRKLAESSSSHSRRRLVELSPQKTDESEIVLSHYFDLKSGQTYSVEIAWTFSVFESKADFLNPRSPEPIEKHAKSDPVSFSVAKSAP